MARRTPSTWRLGIDEIWHGAAWRDPHQRTSSGCRLRLRRRRPRLRAQCSGVDPRLDQFAEQRLRARGGIASGARLPAPCNEIVVRQMLVEERKVTTAVAVGILDLATNLAHRLAFPCHLDRGGHPARMARNAAIRCLLVQREIPVGVTGHAWRVTRRQRLMRMLIVSLRWTIRRGMTVHAAGMRQHLGHLGKKGA